MNISHIAKILFILLLVLILIAVNAGLIRWSIWFQILKIWPIIFVALVLEFTFRYLNFAFLKIIPIFLATSAILAVVYLSGTPGLFSPKKIKTQEIIQTLGDNYIRNLDVAIVSNNSRLSLEGNADDLYSGNISYCEGAPPMIRIGQSGNEFRFALTANSHSQYLFGPADSESVWNLKLNNAPFTNLDVESNYNINNFDFTHAKILNISLNSRLDRSVIKIGDSAEGVKINIDANFSKIKFILPSWIGARIRMNAKATFTNVKSLGFNKSNEIFISANYLTSAKKIDINVASFASIVDFELYKQ